MLTTIGFAFRKVKQVRLRYVERRFQLWSAAGLYLNRDIVTAATHRKLPLVHAQIQRAISLGDELPFRSDEKKEVVVITDHRDQRSGGFGVKQPVFVGQCADASWS